MTPSRCAVAWGVAIAAAACGGGAEIAGGRTVAPGKEPAGKVVARFDAIECRDALGRAVPFAPSSWVLLDTKAGGRVLLESRPELDTVVVDNTFVDGGQTAYQVILDGKMTRPFLRDYRVAKDGSSIRLRVASYWEATDTGSGFVARFRRAVLTCDAKSEPR